MAYLASPSLQDETQEQEEILHFSLAGLLPEHHCLAIHHTRMVLLGVQQSMPRLLHSSLFTNNELLVALPLLEAYPYYCAHEVLLASFNTGRVTEATIARSRQRLHESQQAGMWDLELRPIRGAISRTRFKLREMGIDITSLLDTGYMLRSYTVRRSSGQDW